MQQPHALIPQAVLSVPVGSFRAVAAGMIPGVRVMRQEELFPPGPAAHESDDRLELAFPGPLRTVHPPVPVDAGHRVMVALDEDDPAPELGKDAVRAAPVHREVPEDDGQVVIPGALVEVLDDRPVVGFYVPDQVRLPVWGADKVPVIQLGEPAQLRDERVLEVQVARVPDPGQNVTFPNPVSSGSACCAPSSSSRPGAESWLVPGRHRASYTLPGVGHGV